MTTNKDKIIWAGYSFAQERVVKRVREQMRLEFKEMMRKEV